jgi:ABC-type lipoprotein export system ATPase subunit
MTWLKANNLCRYYQRGSAEVKALDGVTLAIDKGEFVALVGSSGSGKTTLLNLIAGLDTPTDGSISIDGQPLAGLSPKSLASFRAKRIGMIFQSFNLIPHHTATKNIEMGLYFSGMTKRERRTRVASIVEKLGLDERHDHRPADLSGGEQQRVAIARALVKEPEIILADEPTGNLDQGNSEMIMKLLTGLHEAGQTIIMVTHDISLAEANADRTIKLEYGKVFGDRS